MFSKLPDHIKTEIILFLGKEDFRAAKAVYDHWLGRQVPAQKPSSSGLVDNNF